MLERAGTSVAAAVFAAMSGVAADQCSRVGSLSSSTDFSTKSVRCDVKASEKGEKFALKFDGLRFIETLVTAHR